MDISRIHENNAVWWNETADWYAEQGQVSGGNHLFPSERELLGDLTPWCRRAVHLQCSDGRDVLSLWRQGAHEVVGIDISEGLLAVARRKTDAIGANASFIYSDILETPHYLDGTFDLVYTGKGALCWMMDIEAWAKVVSRLLNGGGLFFLHEAHPLDWVWDKSAAEYKLDAEHGDYFSDKPRKQLVAATTQTTPEYRQWTIADVVNSLIRSGLTVERLEEYNTPFWPQLPQETLRCLPHSFALCARKLHDNG
jgi:SAM-dependent methyltransferase